MINTTTRQLSLIENLPDEMLCTVLSFLKEPELREARQVCKTFKTAIDNDSHKLLSEETHMNTILIQKMQYFHKLPKSLFTRCKDFFLDSSDVKASKAFLELNSLTQSMMLEKFKEETKKTDLTGNNIFLPSCGATWDSSKKYCSAWWLIEKMGFYAVGTTNENKPFLFLAPKMSGSNSIGLTILNDGPKFEYSFYSDSGIINKATKKSRKSLRVYSVLKSDIISKDSWIMKKIEKSFPRAANEQKEFLFALTYTEILNPEIQPKVEFYFEDHNELCSLIKSPEVQPQSIAPNRGP
ncbi:MAG: F-box protein [Verrucomicrobia bacterium]|nr:F-box protein [Verrucomicrobiota bacterium]